MGTKGTKAGNIYSSLKSRGLIGGQGQDPSIKGMGSAAKFNPTLEKKAQKGELPANFAEAIMENKSGSPLKQTRDGSDASVFGSVKRVAKNAVKAYNNKVLSVADKLTTGFGNGNRHMDGPAPSQPSQPSKPSKQSYSASKRKSKTPQQSYSAVSKSIEKDKTVSATPFKKKSCKY